MNLSEPLINRLNELQLPNTPDVNKILKILLRKKDNILVVLDMPNGMKQVEILEPPSHYNGPEPDTTGEQES